MKRASLAGLLALAACKQSPTTPHAPPQRPTPRTAATQPAHPTVPVTPSPHGDGPTVGFALQHVEAVRDEDGLWLELSTRVPPPGQSETLVRLGPQRQCHDVEPLALRARGASRARQALVSVRCDGPPRADFSVLRDAERRWVVARSGCADGFFPCPPGALPDEIVSSTALRVEGPQAGPLATYENTPAPHGATRVAANTALIRWVPDPVVDPLLPGTAPVTPWSLTVEGVTARKISLGMVPNCAPSTTPVAGLAGALLTLRCPLANGALRWFAVTHDDDMVRLRTALVGANQEPLEAASIPSRVGLPHGTRVTALTTN